MVPSDILRTAGERGIRTLGITDHYYPFTDPEDVNRTRSDVLEALARTDGSLRVFIGSEVEVMAPGRTAGSPELAERLDFVMVGATHFQTSGVTDLPPGDDELHARYYLKMFEYAVSLPWVNVLAHPLYVVPGVASPELLKLITEKDLLPGIETARANEVALEISPRAISPWQIEFSRRLYALCKRAGVKFTIGSDAHQLPVVGNVRVLEPLIAELGLSEKDFWLPSF